MKAQLQKRLIGFGTLIAVTFALGGCTSSHPSMAWQGPGMYAGSAGNSSAVVFSPGLSGTGNLAYLNDQGPEFGRRDHTLSTRDLSRRDELFGVRQQPQTSLNNRRYFRTSRNADEYTYPTQDRRGNYGSRRTYRSR